MHKSIKKRGLRAGLWYMRERLARGNSRRETVQRVKPYKGVTLIYRESKTQDLKPFPFCLELSYTWGHQFPQYTYDE